MSIAHDGGAVDICGDLPAEALVQQIVLGRRGQILRAAHDVGDAHEVVVNDVCEVIRRQTVALYEHLIVKRGVFNGNVAENLVVEGRAALGGYPLTHDEGFARGDESVAFLARKGAAGVGGLFKALGLLLLFAEAAVGVPLLDEKLCVFAVKSAALGLNVGAHGTADVGTLVVAEPALCHGAVNDVHGALDVALLIGVLDAQDELSAGMTGDEPGVQSRAQVAYVHISRGAGGKSRAYLALGYARLHFLKPGHIHKYFLQI